MRTLKFPKNADEALFAFTLFLTQFFSLHGKALMEFVFLNTSTPLLQGMNNFWVWFVSLVTIVGYLALRRKKLDPRLKSFFLALLGLFAALAVQIHATSKSFLGFLLTLYSYGVISFIIITEPYLSLRANSNFWHANLELAQKMVSLAVIIFVGGFAILQQISLKSPSDLGNLLTTFIYPFLVLITTIVQITIWMIFPLLANFYSSSKKTRRHSLRP